MPYRHICFIHHLAHLKHNALAAVTARLSYQGRLRMQPRASDYQQKASLSGPFVLFMKSSLVITIHCEMKKKRKKTCHFKEGTKEVGSGAPHWKLER